MQALETTATILDHRVVIENATLPVRAERARGIVLWDNVPATGRRMPPPQLAGLGKEIGDIVAGAPESDWEALA